MMHRALQAAETLAREGISAEVIDPRSLVPFDWDLVKESVMKTTRAVIVEEGPKRGGWSAEIAATLAETMSDYLTAPVTRVASPDIPVPFAPPMENFYRPECAADCRCRAQVLGCGIESGLSLSRGWRWTDCVIHSPPCFPNPSLKIAAYPPRASLTRGYLSSINKGGAASTSRAIFLSATGRRECDVLFMSNCACCHRQG